MFVFDRIILPTNVLSNKKRYFGRFFNSFLENYKSNYMIAYDTSWDNLKINILQYQN